MYTLLIYGFGLDMKIEDKRPKGRSPAEGESTMITNEYIRGVKRHDWRHL